MGKHDESRSYRRAYARYSINASAVLSAGTYPGRGLIVRDISVRGLGIITDFTLVRNEKLDIALSIPSLRRLLYYKKPRVVWCHRLDDTLWRCGLDFGLTERIEL